MRIDFFARRTHFVDHLLPVWEKIPWINRGKFYVPDSIASYVPKDFCILETCKNPVNCHPPYSENPMVVCAYGDMERKEKIMDAFVIVILVLSCVFATSALFMEKE